MSRVHDALRRAEEAGLAVQEYGAGSTRAEEPRAGDHMNGSRTSSLPPVRLNLHAGMLNDVPKVAFQPAPESHLLDLNNSHETPAEEFRTLRTRLNHLQTLQPLHTVIITSPSPAEGKTFAAVNLALAQAHFAESAVLLADFDLRRPIIHSLFQVD